MDSLTHALSGVLLGAAFAPSEEQRLPFIVLGAVAGSMPDLDFLCELRGKVAAWRYHRVLLHGIPMLLPQALVLYGLSAFTVLAAAPQGLVLSLIVAGLLTHVFLDSVTSFGTALGFPFSRRRFSTRSHFVVDPLVLMILGAGLYCNMPRAALAVGSAYLISVVVWRQGLLMRARRCARNIGARAERTSVEPGPAAPWRWLVVTERVDGNYVLAKISWPGCAPLCWREVPSRECPESDREQATRIPLIAAFLATADFPRWSRMTDDPRQRDLIVEDVKWWSVLPFRPLAFSIVWQPNQSDPFAQQQRLSWRARIAPSNVPT